MIVMDLLSYHNWGKCLGDLFLAQVVFVDISFDC